MEAHKGMQWCVNMGIIFGINVSGMDPSKWNARTKVPSSSEILKIH